MPSAWYSRRRSAYLFLFVLAVALRLFYLFDLKDYELADRLHLDPASYDRKAEAILRGESPSPGRAFYQSPLYAYFLAGIYSVAGRDFDAVRFVQVLLGGATVVLLAAAGAAWFGSATGWIAGIAAALYAPFPFYEAQIMKTSLGVFLTAAALLSLARRRTGPALFASGTLLALASLVRETDLLLLVLAAAAVLVSGERRAGGARRVAVLLAGGLLVLAPVAIRNRIVSGDWVVTTAQGGQNFYIGNNERAEGTYTELDFVRPDPRFEEEDFRAEAHRLSGRDLSASELSRFWYGEGLRWMRDDPAAAAGLLARKAILFWNALELPDNENFYYMRDRFRSLGLFPIGFGAVAVFALVGMGCSIRRFRPLFFLYAGVGTSFVALTVFYVFSRYRVAAVPFLILFAAEGAFCGARALIERRRLRAAAIAAGLLAASWLVFAARPIDFDPRVDGYLPLHVNRAMLFAEAGEKEVAIAEYREALRIAPDRPSIRRRLARLLLDAGREDEAIREMEEVVRRLPEDGRTRNDLAVLLLQRGRKDEALLLLREAVRLEPEIESPHRNLGRLLVEMGEAEEGAREIARADSLRASRGRP